MKKFLLVLITSLLVFSCGSDGISKDEAIERMTKTICNDLFKCSSEIKNSYNGKISECMSEGKSELGLDEELCEDYSKTKLEDCIECYEKERTCSHLEVHAYSDCESICRKVCE